MATVTMVDPELGVEVLDDTGLDLDAKSVWENVLGQNPEVAAIVRWTSTVTGNDLFSQGGSRSRAGTIFQRDRYVTPGSVHEQFVTARDAVESDDVVSGVADSTESLVFNRMSFLTEDEDEEDVWNQIAADLDLDSRLREMWRELFIYSQFYSVIWWGTKSYKVRGKTSAGNARRKEFNNLRVPLGLTMLDPLKVVPVGGLLFNQEKLAYLSDPSERDMLDAAAANDPEADPLARQLILSRYQPNLVEARQLMLDGIPLTYLYLLNPDNVFRHTATRSQYQRFAAVRMKSVFELLDLKAQLKQMDRAMLLGGTNFIVLVKKGTDQRPATPKEVNALQAQVRTVARVPVIVGDHRLSVEIVTPKTDNTLAPERYNGLDARITARLYQMFMTGNYRAGAQGDDSIKLAMVVARGMESRRRQLRRQLEAKVLRPTTARNDQFSEEPKLRFHPARIELTFDAAMVQFLIDCRDRGDISRETYLNEIDVDQADEAMLRKREKARYDSTFTPTNVPFTAPNGAPATAKPAGAGGAAQKQASRTAGRNQGGTRNGGGAAPGSGQGQAPRRGRAKEAAVEEGDVDHDGDDDE
jgi:hypothetical protein